AKEWIEEANRRGLPNIKSMIDAVATLTTDKAISLYERFGIFTKAELESRSEILYDNYSNVINIEALTMIDMAGKQIIPAVIQYTTSLADSLSAITSVCPEADTSVQKELLIETSAYLSDMKVALAALIDAQTAASAVTDPRERAYAYRDIVTIAMAQLRTPADKLEMIVDKKLWPIPTYDELMFEV
ncbi:MAG: glutamine synthetase type III, partial [Lachnospiraceae bacterium]